MTHKQKIKALIEAGEKAGDEGHADWFDQDDKRFYRRAANARDSINLLAEIAEAAGELCKLRGDVTKGDRARLDDLLAKYKPKEARDASNP